MAIFFAVILLGAKEHVENLYQPVKGVVIREAAQQGSAVLATILVRTLHRHYAELMRHALPGQRVVTLKFTFIQSSTV